jgi:hypothetical protein
LVHWQVVNQHFVTEFYLKAFCDPVRSPRHGASVWEVDMLAGSVRRKPPKRVATERDYYSFIDPTGEINHQIEEMLSAVESRAAPLVAKLQLTKLDLTEEERSGVAVFVAFLMVRVPAIRGYIEEAWGKLGESLLRLSARHPEHFKQTMTKALTAAGQPPLSKAETERMRQLALDPAKHFTIKGRPEASLAQALEMVIRIAGLLFEMRWELLAVTGSERLITGDMPVTWRDPTGPKAFGAGLGMPGVELSLPLSPSVCFVASWKGRPGVSVIRQDRVRDLNRERVRHADRFIYTASEAAAYRALETYAALKADGQAHATPVRVILFEEGRWPTAVTSPRLNYDLARTIRGDRGGMRDAGQRRTPRKSLRGRR